MHSVNISQQDGRDRTLDLVDLLLSYSGSSLVLLGRVLWEQLLRRGCDGGRQQQQRASGQLQLAAGGGQNGKLISVKKVNNIPLLGL